MLFNSLAFLAFAPIFFVVYFLTTGRTRLLWCIAASYFFYAWWDWHFVWLLAGSTAIAFICGRRIANSGTVQSKRFWLWFCILAHLLTLAVFKYSQFAIDSAATLVGFFGLKLTPPVLGISLPIGISFFTFTALSYCIDVYKGKLEPEKDWIHFATYECLFPHLVAGPILRASRFLPQLKQDQKFSGDNLKLGIEMIVWGFVLKLCVGDNAALFTDNRFSEPRIFTSASLAISVVLFAFQIYGDFAGYSLIAIGLARIMGFDFGINFNRPYFASSFSDFWQRWHISLSSWLRDYLYIPLGGNRCSRVRQFGNLMFTMLIAGLWHGAAWTFVVWGLLHGVFLAIQHALTKKEQPEVRFGFAGRLITSLVVFFLVCVAWIPFRCRTLSDSMYVFHSLIDWRSTSHLSFGGMKYQLIRCCLIIIILLAVEIYTEIYSRRTIEPQHRDFWRALRTAGALTLILVFGVFSANSFIYFQF